MLNDKRCFSFLTAVDLAGDLDSEHGFCQWIAKTVNVVVISIGYRLGPEWKLPAMVEDVISVFEEVRALQIF